MKQEELYIIGIPLCILIYWFVYHSTSDWFLQSLAGIISFGSLAIVGRYLQKKEAEAGETLEVWVNDHLKYEEEAEDEG